MSPTTEVQHFKHSNPFEICNGLTFDFYTQDCHTYNYITQHIIMVSTRRRQEMGGAQGRKKDGMMEESGVHVYTAHISWPTYMPLW